MATVPFDASLRHLLLDPSDLKETGQRLGEGQYGVVWAAVWTCKDTRKEVKVAVKTIKKSAMISNDELQTQKAFILNELKILSQIRAHKYVIGLVGALEDSIVFEFCEFGSLEDFLIGVNIHKRFQDEIQEYKAFRGGIPATTYTSQRNSNWSSDYKNRRRQGKITTSDLLAFSYQIVTGVTFLQGKKILHRDLALRNVLLTDDFIVKIADFGLSRITYDDRYIPKNMMIALPPESPPEVLYNIVGAVCLNADWWTLGVLFWTVFSLGSEQPPTTQMREFMKKTHQVPSRPKFAPYEIYALMLDLWMLDPEDRADLRECKTKIKRQLKASCLPLVEELMKIDKEIEIQQLQQHQPEENQQQVTEGHQQHHYQPHQYQQQHQYQQPLKQQQQQQQQQQEPLETEENQEQEPINPEEGKAKKKSLYSKDAKRRLRLLEHKRKLLCGFSVITLLLVILLIWCLWNFILPIDTNKPSLEGPERNDSNNTEQPNITGPLESTLVPIIEKQRDDTSTIPYDSLTSAATILTTPPTTSTTTLTTTSTTTSPSGVNVCLPTQYSGPEGVLLSPGFRTNQNYGNNLNCMYQVTVQVGYTIILTVNSFVTVGNYDILYIYDGSSTTSPLLAELSGTVAVGEQLETTGNTLTAKFITDGYNNRAGFSIKYSQFPPEQSFPLTQSEGPTIIYNNPEHKFLEIGWMKTSININKNGILSGITIAQSTRELWELKGYAFVTLLDASGKSIWISPTYSIEVVRKHISGDKSMKIWIEQIPLSVLPNIHRISITHEGRPE